MSCAVGRVNAYAVIAILDGSSIKRGSPLIAVALHTGSPHNVLSPVGVAEIHAPDTAVAVLGKRPESKIAGVVARNGYWCLKGNGGSIHIRAEIVNNNADEVRQLVHVACKISTADAYIIGTVNKVNG